MHLLYKNSGSKDIRAENLQLQKKDQILLLNHGEGSGPAKIHKVLNAVFRLFSRRIISGSCQLSLLQVISDTLIQSRNPDISP
jgi:hypothetical protein